MRQRLPTAALLTAIAITVTNAGGQTAFEVGDPPPGAGILRGRLVLADGAPGGDLEVALVSFSPTGTQGLARVRSEPDGSFRMIIAHRDPGVPNWLDTEGRPFGMVFWRFMLPEGEIETPQAQVVPFAEVARR